MSLLLAAALFLLSPNARAMTPAEQLQTRIAGDRAFEQGEFATAAELYQKLLPDQPDNGALRYDLAFALFRSGNAEAAAPQVMKAIELGHGRRSRIYMAMAQSAAKSGDREHALQFLSKALEDRYEQAPDLRTDEDFASLRDDPEFRRLVGYAPEGLSRTEGWSRDLDFFLQEVGRLHVDFDGYAHSPQIQKDVDALRARVGELDDEHMAVDLQRIIAKLGDGHSSLWGVPTERVTFPSMPVEFYLFSDGLFVISADERHRDLIGSRVVAIGDRSADHLMEDLGPFVSHDNRQGVLSGVAHYARRFVMLEMTGYTDRTDRAVLTLESKGETRKVTITPSTGLHPQGLRPLGGKATERTPLWLRDVDNRYWHRAMPDIDALYVQFNSVRDKDDGPSLDDYARELDQVLVTEHFRNVIVDVRHNGGGNNFRIWPLIRVLASHTEAAPENRLWIITSRHTFSACQDFVNFADRILDPIFVGEPSGSKPNFIGETGRVQLPWSGLRLSLSSRYWQDSFPNDRRQYIPVQMPAPLAAADYFGRRDPAMAAIAEAIQMEAGGTATTTAGE